jgi:hypothetical protein
VIKKIIHKKKWVLAVEMWKIIYFYCVYECDHTD